MKHRGEITEYSSTKDPDVRVGDSSTFRREYSVDLSSAVGFEIRELKSIDIETSVIFIEAFEFQNTMEEVARGDPKSSLLQKLLSEWLQATMIPLRSKGLYVIYVKCERRAKRRYKKDVKLNGRERECVC